MKPGQSFALITGVFFLIVGVLGFIPAFVKGAPTAAEAVSVYPLGYGYLMGLFPINLFHNVVHLSVGILGIAASVSPVGPRIFGRGLAIFYGVLAVMGLFPFTNLMFGFVPIFGNDVWLHAIFAAIGFYFGFIASPELVEASEYTANKGS
ncbi:MAG: DUF4383 domain-containing protein [Kastovskya adunca ATA6-11-RM4]|jgi:hypothetical protein|nr:DUF4383 domain-containing protein [Kastovskya adunca ATA6-11-RM4]